VAGVAVLSESHISIHSWPDAEFAAVDIFMCGDTEPQKCVDVLREAFQARNVVVKTHRRGEEAAQPMAPRIVVKKSVPQHQVRKAKAA